MCLRRASSKHATALACERHKTPVEGGGSPKIANLGFAEGRMTPNIIPNHKATHATGARRGGYRYAENSSR